MNKLKASLVLSASLMLLPTLGCVSGTFVEPPIEGGKRVPEGSLTDKLAWLETNADSRNTYIVEVNANENVAPRIFEYEGATDITIVLRGVGANQTLRLGSHGTMFTVKHNVKLVLDSNITLMGHSQNTGPMVDVDGGEFVMRSGSSITGNARGSGDGGGVYVRSGNFKMTGGTISGNTAENGGGVYVADGSFAMLCGTISGNTANNQGGGVYDRSIRVNPDNGMKESNFTMGVKAGSVSSGYNMQGCGIITGNTAREQGGGVYQANNAGFGYDFKGTITGYKSDPNGGNVVRDEVGNVLSNKGHAWGGPRDGRDNTFVKWW